MFKKFSTLAINPTVASEIFQLIQANANVLADYRFAPPSASEKSRMGFSFTGIGNEEYVSKLGDDLVIKVTSQGKTINKNEVKDVHTKKRQVWMNENQNELIPKKTNEILLEDSLIKVMASTFPNEAKHSYMVIRKDGLVFVEGTGKGMEDVVSLLRKAVGTFPAFPYIPEGSDLSGMLKDWVRDDINDTIGLGQAAILLSAPIDGGSGVEYKTKGNIGSDPKALSILKDDLAVATQVAVTFDGIMDVTVSDEMIFSAIKFSSEVTSDAEDLGAGLLLMMTKINRLVNTVIERSIKAGK